MKTELKKRSLQSLADARLANELRPKPEYQRGTVWKLPQKQGLIDSLLRGYQIPLFYVHLEERSNNYTGGVEKTAWIVPLTAQEKRDAWPGDFPTLSFDTRASRDIPSPIQSVSSISSLVLAVSRLMTVFTTWMDSLRLARFSRDWP